MSTIGSHYKSVTVVVRHHGDTHHARAGNGYAAQLASSTNSGIIAAEAAARKFFGREANITLDLKQAGDGCTGVPSIYLATKGTP